MIRTTVRHEADLVYVPVVVADVCGSGSEEGARHALELLDHAGDVLITETATISALLREAAAPAYDAVQHSFGSRAF